MAAFFLVHDLDGNGPPGAMLLQHAVDEAKGQSWHQSRVTRETIDHHNSIATRVINSNVQPQLRGLAQRRHFTYAAMSARDNGILEDTEGPRLETAPFTVAWNDFFLAENNQGLTFKTALADNSTADLTLTPLSAWLDERSDRLHPDFGPAFAYQCCPRLQTTGTVDGAPVEGQFWVDRQWGQYEGWLLAPQKAGYRVLGWDWFGLNLDDGRDLLISRHRDAASARTDQIFGIIFNNGRPELSPRVNATPTRHWSSPQTAIRYPVAWELEVPELGLVGAVEPVIEDQEIPVYGTEAIWEGAVRFQGRNAKSDVRGHGRLELVGYGTPLTIGAHLRRNVTRFATGMSAAFRSKRRG